MIRSSHQPSALVIGGYGFFGKRLCTLLARNEELHVIVGGRRKEQAVSLAEALQREGARAKLSAVQLDSSSPELNRDIVQTGAQIVVNLAGPFQGQDYRVAESCIRARSHYIDLADARNFVCGIACLNATAEAAGVLVTSGASSVPALSSAVVEHLASHFTSITRIDIGISPGNRTDRGRATVEAILSYCGEPVQIWKDARWSRDFAWTRQTVHAYPHPVGRRWLTPCDVADLTLLPKQYPETRTVTFQAGLELPLLHFGLAFLGTLRRWQIIPNLGRFAPALMWVAERFKRFGSDAGAMHVDLIGKGLDGRDLGLRWTLVAEHGDGPFIPTLAAAAIVRRLARNELGSRGALPCIGLLRLGEIFGDIDRLAIRTRVETL